MCAALVSEEWAAKFSLKQPHNSSCDAPSRHTSYALGDPSVLTGMGNLLDDSDSSSSSGQSAASTGNKEAAAAAAADMEAGLPASELGGDKGASGKAASAAGRSK
jgi:hypothetical protein